MNGPEWFSDVQRVHAMLRGDIALVSQYGEEHPETFAGMWVDNEPTVRIVAAFTSDLEQHDAALRPQLSHPDRLAIQRMPHSHADLLRVREEITRTLEQQANKNSRPAYSSIGVRKAVLHVALRADQEKLASEFAARYGNAVELVVGAFGFPGRRRIHPQPPVAPAPAEQTFDGLEVTVEVDQKVVEVGDDGRGRIVLRNNGQDRIGPLDTGEPKVGTLLNASHEAVGGFYGAIAGVGRFIDLAPGASASIRFIYGTASRREEIGYVLPPGTYWLKVQMDFRRGPGEPTRVLTTPLTEITLVARG